jgi:hypothetical protein
MHESEPREGLDEMEWSSGCCDKTLFTSFGLGRFKGARPYIVLARIHSRQIARALTCANAENAASWWTTVEELTDVGKQ